jgi:hypothetical protein
MASCVPRIELGRGGEEGRRVGVGRAREQPLGRADLDDRAEIHHGHPMRQVAHHAQIMGNEQDREAEPRLQIQQQVDDLRLHGNVEGGDDLVGDDHLGLDRERSRDADALALAAAERVGIALGRRGRQPDQLEQLGDARGGFARRPQIVEADRLGEGLADGQARIERAVGILEHHLDAAVIAPPRGAFEGQHVLAVELDAAAFRLVEAHEAAGERRLAAAGFADDAEGLASPHLEAHAGDGRESRCRPSLQDIERAAMHREPFAEVPHGEKGRSAAIRHELPVEAGIASCRRQAD